MAYRRKRIMEGLMAGEAGLCVLYTMHDVQQGLVSGSGLDG
jgi:hypothetical protein